MRHFLAKTDPDTYSIDDFEKEGETIWDGVHNYQAINYIKEMHPGDQVYIYHSQSDKAIVGLAEVTGEPYENKADTRFSWAVKLKFLKHTKHLGLSEMKGESSLSGFKLLINPRLSTMSVPEEAAIWINERL